MELALHALPHHRSTSVGLHGSRSSSVLRPRGTASVAVLKGDCLFLPAQLVAGDKEAEETLAMIL